MSTNLDPDAALMLLVKQGDMAAFERLVDKYKQPIINLASRTLNDETEAEDLAQNVFVQVFKSAKRYHAKAKFSTWLYTIARNLCLNELRRRARRPAYPLDTAAVEHEDSAKPQYEDLKTRTPTETMLEVELARKIEQALAELPENQRTAILLFREQDMSYEQIAKALGISLSATKSLIHRGRETLKQKLKPYLRSGTWQ